MPFYLSLGVWDTVKVDYEFFTDQGHCGCCLQKIWYYGFGFLNFVIYLVRVYECCIWLRKITMKCLQNAFLTVFCALTSVLTPLLTWNCLILIKILIIARYFLLSNSINFFCSIKVLHMNWFALCTFLKTSHALINLRWLASSYCLWASFWRMLRMMSQRLAITAFLARFACSKYSRLILAFCAITCDISLCHSCLWLCNFS